VIAAADVGYDVVFLVHVAAAIATVVVLASLRVSAGAVGPGANREVLRARFPDRVDWAARVVHLLPVSGLAMSLSGDAEVSLARPWLQAGVALYLVLAYWLEARILPAERALARRIHAAGELDARAGAPLARGLDTALVILAVILVVMIGQF
jgi:hypothetical protein